MTRNELITMLHRSLAVEFMRIVLEQHSKDLYKNIPEFIGKLLPGNTKENRDKLINGVKDELEKMFPDQSAAFQTFKEELEKIKTG